MRGPLEQRRLSAMVAGPVIWAGYFVFAYVFVSLACAAGWDEVRVAGLNVVTAILILAALLALAVIGARGWTLYRLRRNEAGRASPAHDEREERVRFMGLVALLLYALSFLAIVWSIVPMLVFAPCR